MQASFFVKFWRYIIVLLRVVGYNRNGLFMFLRKNYSNKTGRTHLAIVQGYRDTDGKNKHKTVQRVGYLDELQKEYEDPIAHFTAVAEAMDKREKSKRLYASHRNGSCSMRIF